MNSIETAIRNALGKGDAGDAAFREKVYLSALSALERTLASNAGISAETAAARREALRNCIRMIETEYQPALEAEEPAAPEPEAVANVEPSAPEPAVRVESPAPEPDRAASSPAVEIGGERPPAPDFVSELRAPERSRRTRAEKPARHERRKLHPFATFFTVVVLLVFVAMGIWGLIQSGALQTLAQRDGSVPNPPPRLSEDEYKPDGGDAANPDQAGINGTWLVIFAPTDPSTVSAPGGTEVEVIGEGKDQSVRVKPTATDSAALFDIGQGILEQIAGKKATFDITARSATQASTQISIQCNFAELGDCGRKRFDVDPTRNEYLFEIDLKDAAPGSAGSLALTPDIAKGANPVDIYMVRVFVPDAE